MLLAQPISPFLPLWKEMGHPKPRRPSRGHKGWTENSFGMLGELFTELIPRPTNFLKTNIISYLQNRCRSTIIPGNKWEHSGSSTPWTLLCTSLWAGTGRLPQSHRQLLKCKWRRMHSIPPQLLPHVAALPVPSVSVPQQGSAREHTACSDLFNFRRYAFFQLFLNCHNLDTSEDLSPRIL